MKKYLLFGSVLLLVNAADAQWAFNGIHIHNTNAGFVGIGTTTPAQRLHVEGSSNQAIFVSTTAPGATSGSGFIGSVKNLPTGAGNRLGYFLAGSRGGAQSGLNAAGIVGYSGGAWTAGVSHPAYLAFETTTFGQAARAERMRIAPNGNVGIGTTSPSQKLHVQGNQVLEGNLSFTSGFQSIQFANPGASSNPMLFMFASGTSNPNRMVIGHSPSFPNWGLQYSDAVDRFDFLGAGASRLSVDLGSGNIGIGVSSAENRLHIKQFVANRAIQWQHESTNDYWTVGIGTNTLNCRFEFNGAGKGQISSVDGVYSQISDERLKEEIEPVENLLEKILKLKPSKYYYKDSRHIAKNKAIGFIAQDVEKVLPELVYEEDGGYKWLNYSQFSVLAVKAIQEQQQMIEEQREQNKELAARIDKLEAIINKLTNGQSIHTAATSISLSQNSPNPVRGSTIIRYTLPDGVSSAQLLLTDALGRTVRTIQLTTSGVVNLDVSALSGGVYNYSIAVGGKILQTKKMTVSR